MVGIIEKKQKTQEFSLIMCKVEESSSELIRERKGGNGGGGNGGDREWKMDIKLENLVVESPKVDKLRGNQRSRKLRQWMLKGLTSIILWFALLLLLHFSAIETWRPTVMKGWPYNCFSNTTSSLDSHLNVVENSLALPKIARPPKRVYKNNGYLMVSCNGGLNQMRAAICDMVAIARYLNVTLIVPELDKTSFWKDPSDFQDIFDVDHFINSLRDEVRILKELPSHMKNRLEEKPAHSLAPVSWSDLSYYHNQILPYFLKNKVVHLNKTDSRLANNGLPLEIQKLQCKVNYQALKFTPQI